MVKLRRTSSKELMKFLNKRGFEKVRQKGSHVVMKKITDQETKGCVVPLHKELAIGTIGSILRQAGIPPEDYYDNI